MDKNLDESYSNDLDNDDSDLEKDDGVEMGMNLSKSKNPSKMENGDGLKDGRLGSSMFGSQEKGKGVKKEEGKEEQEFSCGKCVKKFKTKHMVIVHNIMEHMSTNEAEQAVAEALGN